MFNFVSSAICKPFIWREPHIPHSCYSDFSSPFRLRHMQTTSNSRGIPRLMTNKFIFHVLFLVYKPEVARMVCSSIGWTFSDYGSELCWENHISLLNTYLVINGMSRGYCFTSLFPFPASLSLTITMNNSLHSLDLLMIYDNMHTSSIWNWRK